MRYLGLDARSRGNEGNCWMWAWRTITCLALMFVLQGCSRHGGESSGTAAADGPTRAGPQYDSEKILNIYSWADYIAPETVGNFERETGIKVHYGTYDNNEVLETQLLTGHTNYDVVDPTETFFERQLQAGVYRKLDKSALPNLVNLDPEIMRRMALHDPGNLYAVPYMWTTTGLGFNVDQVRARLGANPTNSWALLFDPANAAKLQNCGITIIDSAMDVFSASEVLRKIRPFIRYIDPAQHIPDLANGSACLALAWSGDVEQARSRAVESNTGAHIAYIVPREGALITVDMMGIPADAPHPHN